MDLIIHIVWPFKIASEKNRAFYQRIRTLSKNYSVILYTFNKAMIDSELATLMEVYRFPYNLGKLQKLFYTLWVLIILRKTNKINQKGVIYTINHRQYLLGWVAKRLFGMKWAIDFFHSPEFQIQTISNLKQYPMVILHRLLIIILKQILREVDLALVMTHDKRGGFGLYLSKFYNVPQKNIIAVPSGVDLSITQSIENERSDRHHERHEYVNLIHAGGISNHKFLCVAHFLEKAFREGLPIRVTLLGVPENGVKGQFLEWVQRNSSWVNYLGYVSHERALLEIIQADVGMCLLSGNILDYEYSHPVKIYEYLALQKPVFAPDFEGIKGIVENGKSGLLYQWDNQNDFLNKLKHLVNHPEVIRQMGQEAGKRAKEFEWPKLNSLVVNAFKNVIEANIQL